MKQTLLSELLVHIGNKTTALHWLLQYLVHELRLDRITLLPFFATFFPIHVNGLERAFQHLGTT